MVKHLSQHCNLGSAPFYPSPSKKEVVAESTNYYGSNDEQSYNAVNSQGNSTAIGTVNALHEEDTNGSAISNIFDP
jgi:hypothetical protein